MLVHKVVSKEIFMSNMVYHGFAISRAKIFYNARARLSSMHSIGMGWVGDCACTHLSRDVTSRKSRFETYLMINPKNKRFFH